MNTLSEMIMRHGPPIGDVVEHHKREAEHWKQRHDALLEMLTKNAFMHAHPPVTLVAEPESFNAGKEFAERRMLQLFTDPENQPTQYGTVTVEYMQREIAAERNKLAAWMIQFGFSTGHGDTMEQLVDALGSEIVDRIEIEIDGEREACAKVCDEQAESHALAPLEKYRAGFIADAIRARGQA